MIIKYTPVIRDGNVPYDYYRLYDIFKDGQMGVSEDEILDWKKKSIEAVLVLMKKESINDFCFYWNSHCYLFDSNTNYFSRNLKFAPIAHMVEAFQNTAEEDKIKKNGRILISFGIKRSVFNDYALKGIIPQKKLKEQQIITPDSKRYKNYSTKIDDKEGNKKGDIRIKKNALFFRWKDWCALNDISPNVAVLKAIEKQIEENPTKGLKGIESYYTANEPYYSIDYSAGEKEVSVNNLMIENDVYNMIMNYIRLYNDSIDNLSKKNLSLSYVVNLSLKKLLVELELKFKSPELYNKIKEEKQEEAYFNKVIRSGGVK